MSFPWSTILADPEHRIKGSAIRDLLAVTAQPGVISFAGGLPAPELFPVAALRESFDRVFRDEGAAAVQYGPTEGHMPLRRHLAERLSARGIAAPPEQILITTGSQQALDLLGKVLVRPSAAVMVEAPSYVGALQAFTMQGPRYVAVHMDHDGMLVDEARALLSRLPDTPAMLYTVATFQNPSGVTMTNARREALLELSLEHGMPLVEDDPYGDLRYEGQPAMAFRALPRGEDAIYLGTFSKTLAPGLRLGFVVAPRPLIDRMVLAKQAADLHTDSLAQRAVLDFCLHNDLDAHVVILRDVYRARRDAMLAAMRQHFPPTCSWTHPEGGLFTWVTLPERADGTALLKAAIEEKVAFVPGAAFFTDGSGANTMRLNFSHSKPEEINEGIRRLGALLRRDVAGHDNVTPASRAAVAQGVA